MYKEVFQLAKNKGYKLMYPNKSSITGDALDTANFIELSLIQKWLRDSHKMNVIVINYSIWGIASICSANHSKEIKTPNLNCYEKVLLSGINEALQLI